MSFLNLLSTKVMFSDGIRPGGDLTELDDEAHHTPRRSSSHKGSSSKRKVVRGPAGASDVARYSIIFFNHFLTAKHYSFTKHIGTDWLALNFNQNFLFVCLLLVYHM